MELYFKNSEGILQETNLSKILSDAFIKAKFEMSNGSFAGEDHKWIGVVQKTNKPSQILTNICFTDNGNTIVSLNIYESMIVTFVDEENTVQII